MAEDKQAVDQAVDQPTVEQADTTAADAAMRKQVDEENAARQKTAADQAAADAEMVTGAVELDDPDNPDWPDSIPVQSRFGSPKDFVTAQTLQGSGDEKPESTAKAGPKAPVK